VSVWATESAFVVVSTVTRSAGVVTWLTKLSSCSKLVLFLPTRRALWHRLTDTAILVGIISAGGAWVESVDFFIVLGALTCFSFTVSLDISVEAAGMALIHARTCAFRTSIVAVHAHWNGCRFIKPLTLHAETFAED
jgi:hypothetical protein